MFANRTLSPQGITNRARFANERRQLLDHFAECLAGNGTVEQCAARLGRGKAWGAGALKEIRAGLGRQAI